MHFNNSNEDNGGRSIIAAMLTVAFAGIYSWPLILKLPLTLCALCRAFSPCRPKIADGQFFAFGAIDAGFRPWYSKIAKDYHSQGRFGYVWDDGLGMPLGTRIYNNLATYWVLYHLGARRMNAMGFCFMASALTAVLILHFQLPVALLAGIILLGSPLLVGAYTHLGKPETLWWGPAVALVYAVLSGKPLLSGALWSVLAFVNVPIAVMSVLLLGGAALFTLSSSGMLLLVLGALPGGAKLALRGAYMWRSGFLSTLSKEQSRLWKRPWYPTLLDLLWWVPFVTSITICSYMSAQPATGAILLFACIGLYWINFRIIYLNDPQSFHLAFLSIGICYAAVAHSAPALVPLLVMTYLRPDYCGFPVDTGEVTVDGGKWQRRLQKIQLQLKDYPNLKPMACLRPASIMAFYRAIPDGARIVLESDGDPRTASRFRPLEQWMESFLPYRQIDLVNEIYTNLVEPDLMDKYLNKFNSHLMTPLQMHDLALKLGVSHVISYSMSTAEALESVGWRVLSALDMTKFPEFSRVIEIPAVTLTLLEIPVPVTVIEPFVPWQRKGNELSWVAAEGREYLVKYRYDARFHAIQGASELPVEQARVLDDASLRFMKVRAGSNGPISLRYLPKYI